MNSAPDFMPVERLRAIQNEKFIKVFRRTYENVEWYRNLLAKHKVDPNDIRSIADISKLPLHCKDGFARHLSRRNARRADGEDRPFPR